jgi:hypothetical protein
MFAIPYEMLEHGGERQKYIRLSGSCLRPCWSFAIRMDVMSWKFACSHKSCQALPVQQVPAIRAQTAVG